MLEGFSIRYRRLLSGAADGIPAWTPLVAAGDDTGLFGPTDAAWVVHGDIATMIGGVRALIMQALHPGCLAGVVQHSRYEEDVLGRLSGTIRWLTIATFGSREAIAAESERVRQMHAQVRGKYHDADGERRQYRADDPRLLLWVHLAFTDSFRETHHRYGDQPINEDEYVRQWAEAVVPLGLADAPRSAAALATTMDGFAQELRVDDTTRRVVDFVRRAPLPRAARPVYRLLWWAAVDSLPDAVRAELRLRRPPAALTRALTRLLLGGMRWALGSHSPLEAAALDRHRRLADDSDRADGTRLAG